MNVSIWTIQGMADFLFMQSTQVSLFSFPFWSRCLISIWWSIIKCHHMMKYIKVFLASVGLDSFNILIWYRKDNAAYFLNVVLGYLWPILCFWWGVIFIMKIRKPGFSIYARSKVLLVVISIYVMKIDLSVPQAYTFLSNKFKSYIEH